MGNAIPQRVAIVSKSNFSESELALLQNYLFSDQLFLGELQEGWKAFGIKGIAYRFIHRFLPVVCIVITMISQGKAYTIKLTASDH